MKRPSGRVGGGVDSVDGLDAPEETPTSGPLKRPSAATAESPKKRPSANTTAVPEKKSELRVCKYRYKDTGVWGFKLNGKEKIRVIWMA